MLFSALVIIFVFIFSFHNTPYFSTRPDPHICSFDRWKGFSNHMTATVFVMTIINFLLSGLNTGCEIATFTVFIRKVLVMDIDYPLSEKQELVNSALHDLNIIYVWACADNLLVNIKLSLLDPVSVHAQWRYFSVISLSSERAWVLFPDQQWVVLIPFILC